MMTKAQTKALKAAEAHIHAGNIDAFLRVVSHLIRSASNEKQVEAIKVAAYDMQF
jgi:hypothetical protein